MGFVLEALISAHKVELIRIFLTKSRQDGDLFRIDYFRLIMIQK